MSTVLTESISETFLMDCMEGMKQYPENHFDLAVVDPPYGINIETSGTHFKKYKNKGWDNKTPDFKFFNQLVRVSKNQIVWGGNYFTDKLPVSKGWIFWDKMRSEGLSFSDGELAWTSFDKVLKTAKIQYDGFLGMDSVRIHPTQKPVALYDWIFKNYAQPGMKILDTHLGSGSCRISAHKAGMDFTAFELDPDYFVAQEKRFQEYVSQGNLFNPVELKRTESIQTLLL